MTLINNIKLRPVYDDVCTKCGRNIRVQPADLVKYCMSCDNYEDIEEGVEIGECQECFKKLVVGHDENIMQHEC